MRDKTLNNFELIAKSVALGSLTGVIEEAIRTSSQECDQDRSLKYLSFHIENRDGLYTFFDVYRKHTFVPAQR